MTLILIWVGLSIAVGFLAQSKGRSGAGWFVLAILISPLLAGLLALLLPPNRLEAAAREGRVPCRYCAELIRREAIVCPHCRKDVPTQPRVAHEEVKRSLPRPSGADSEAILQRGPSIAVGGAFAAMVAGLVALAWVTEPTSIDRIWPSTDHRRLCDAAAGGSAEAVRDLLRQGSDVSGRCDSGNTPLHIAAFRGSAEIAGILIDARAALDARNNRGETPLNLAENKGWADVAAILRAHGGT
jgi:hypothetical protein